MASVFLGLAAFVGVVSLAVFALSTVPPRSESDSAIAGLSIAGIVVAIALAAGAYAARSVGCAA
jgi:hypothetical protein